MSTTCAVCKRRNRETHPMRRQGGGSYNRAPRSYDSSACTECVFEMLPWAVTKTHAGAQCEGFSVRDIVNRAESLLANEPSGDRILSVAVRTEVPGSFAGEWSVEKKSARTLIDDYRASAAARR